MAKIKLLLPEEVYGELFKQAAILHATNDGKALADAIPKYSVVEILKKYENEKTIKGFEYKNFITENFILVQAGDSGFISNTSESLSNHIKRLWPILTRAADSHVAGSSLIALPYPYIVPGGRFNEIYYWDSYFTMIGLACEKKYDMIESMIDNFAWLIDNIGFIPNGNRTYFLSRSQPPYFSLMLGLLADEKGDRIYVQYLPQLLQEYTFWTSESRVQENIPDNLTRYWDNLSSPRSEMYENDISLANSLSNDHTSLYKNLRAACESGWDFSARWMHDGMDLSTIHTTDILPIDLNCLLYNLEITIAKSYSLTNEVENNSQFTLKANTRKAAILKYMYDEEQSYFFDYDYVKSISKNIITAAGIMPLYFKLLDNEIAEKCLSTLEKYLLKSGGIVCTNISSGQQWDSPNGWAPLQWIAFKSAINYNKIDLATEIAHRWTTLNENVFASTGKMMEKYNVVDTALESGGGEYPVQDGFGWSNGVYLGMKKWLDER